MVPAQPGADQTSIVSYMTKQSLPAVSSLTAESIEDFKTADKVVLVAFFEADDKASNETFTAVADSLRDTYLFGATNDVGLATAEGIERPAIILYKQFDEGKNIFVDKFDSAAITTFAKGAALPLVGEVGPETYAEYMEVRHPSRTSVGDTDADITGWRPTGLHLRRDGRGA